MQSILQAIKSRREVRPSPSALRIRRVVVILSASRGGSSLFKDALARHPDIASLDGELEPLLALSGNGFTQNSNSDALEQVANAEELAGSILDEISFPSPELLEAGQLRRKWKNRLPLQFPMHFIDPAEYTRMERSLETALSQIDQGDRRSEADLQRLVLTAVFDNEPWRIGYYEGSPVRDPGDRFFDEPLKIEEPPFVVPTLRRRLFEATDATKAVLLFKSPPDVYRLGLYEQLFPTAEVSYIHLTRGFAQSVNGLMDGWLHPLGFFSHDMGVIGRELGIPGYSDTVPFGRKWWKFDLPPNWRNFTEAGLEEVCLNQWLSAHEAILCRFACGLRVSFEAFVAASAATLRRVTDHLDLPPMALAGPLPVRMATEPPRARRWQKRAPLLMKLGQTPAVREMMGLLGYSMEADAWL